MEGGSRAGKRLLVLGAGPAQLGLLETAQARGLYVVACDRDPAAVGFRHADRRAIISVEDEPAIDRLATAEHIDGVIAPGIDFPVAVAARIAERLNLRHPLPASAALLATSKLRQRERFAEAGVPQARCSACAGLEEGLVAARARGFPCVVKPPDRQGQRGLAVVEGPDGFADAFEQALEQARGSVVLVEELVPGPELTVNGFSTGGRFQPLTVTDRVVAEPPAFGVALAHVWPSELPAEDVAHAVEVARAAASALGIREGPTYTQIVVGPDGPRVMELAARLGGGHDAELCHAALGVDLNGLAVSAALGEPVSEADLRPDAVAGGACVLFLVPPEGALESVEGTEEAAAGEGVGWVRVYREPGFVFGPLRRGSDRAGAVLAVGETRGQALERAARAAQNVRFRVVAEALVQP